MAMRIAKLAIGLRLYEKRNGDWPGTIEQLTQDSIAVDLGPVMPIGPKPFGYQVTDGAAEVWGFHPEHAGEITPDEPVDPFTRDMAPGQQDLWQYWHWTLPSGG